MFRSFLGIFLMAIVIKLMDDFLDKDIDRLTDQWNLALILERALVPYSFILLILSLYFSFNESVSAFAASYTIGMAGDYKERLPTGLYSWQEGILVLLIGAFISSIYDIIAALANICLIQIIDDLIDLKRDIKTKNHNIVIIYGKVNSYISAGILVLLALRFFPARTGYYLSAFFLLNLLLGFIKKKYGVVNNDY
ncbi:MAG: hypothetical protein GX175_05405 [Halanaerobiaceae bacterium]|nr:hypothetical protein [Halanaerobiaceae bacterium]